MRMVLRNLDRHYRKSLLSAAIGILTVLLLVIYAGNIDSTRSQLALLPEAMEIRGTVSNLNGSQDFSLSIPEEKIEGIAACPETEDQVFTVQMMTGFGKFTLEEWKENLNYFAAGINDVAGVPGLKSEEIRYGKQWNESLFSGRESVCVLDERVMEKKKLKIGDEVLITIYYYQYGKGNIGIGRTLPIIEGKAYKIAGVMDMKEYSGNIVQPDMLFPFENIREIFHETGVDFAADSASFKVKDPFRLNECKRQMEELGFLPVARDADFQYDGNALTMTDEDFIHAAENLRETLTFLTGMLPFVIVIILFVGYLCSYLLIQSRRAEYATMRSVGMGWGRCFFVLLSENAVISALACIAVSLPVLLTGAVSGGALLFSDAVFFLSFLLGGAVALWSFHRLSVMEVLGRGDT